MQIRVPGMSQPLSVRISGITDVSQAKSLFYSREGKQLEQFVYVRNSVIVGPEVFSKTIIPAFRNVTTAPGTTLRSQPILEVDVFVVREPLDADPATALAQTKAVADAVNAVAPGQDVLIDNISNALEVASEDARTAKRMFVFLGLPGALLAAILTSYAGGVLASALRREQAILRIRGANRTSPAPHACTAHPCTRRCRVVARCRVGSHFGRFGTVRRCFGQRLSGEPDRLRICSVQASGFSPPAPPCTQPADARSPARSATSERNWHRDRRCGAFSGSTF